jgi:hypothetical protein
MRELRVPIALVLCALSWGAWLLATGSEISVWADFRRDVAVRDGYALDQINDIRFYDSAPYSIWLPSDVFVWESLRRGELPLWDRSQAGGYSPVLNLQNGVMHPLRWLTVLVPRAFASSMIIIGSLLALALGTFFMLRSVFECSESSALTGSIVLVLSGYVLSTIHFSGVVLPLVHVPWVLWSFDEWATTRRTSAAVRLAVVVALLALSGHPLMIVVALIASGALIVWVTVARGRVRLLAPGIGIGLAGFLLTAFATLPMVLNMGRLWSYKNTTGEGMSYSLVARTGLADALWSMATWMSYEGDFVDGGPLVFHLGLVGTALTAVGLIIACRARSTWGVAIMVLVGVLLSAPPDPVVRLVSKTPLGYFKPWYLMFLFVFPAAIAAAMGMERALGVIPAKYRRAAAAAVMAAVVLPGLRPFGEVLRPGPMLDVSSPAIRFMEDADEPFRVVGLSGQTHVPNTGTLTGVEDVRFSSPVHPLRYHEWYGAATSGADRAFPTIATFEDARSPLLGAFNVRYLLRSTVPGHDVQSFLPRVGDRPSRGYAIDPRPDSDQYRLVLEAGSVEIHESRHFHPRAHFAEEVVVVGTRDEARARLADLSGRSRAEIVESSLPEEWLEVEPASPDDAVHLAYPSMRRVTIDVRASGPRLLVLHDSWDPGWRAELDGRPVQIVPTSLLSRGVMVPAGEHRVEMAFIPDGTGMGIVLTLFAMAGLPLLARRIRNSQERA